MLQKSQEYKKLQNSKMKLPDFGTYRPVPVNFSTF
jgi:hypothetical protein